MPLLKSDKDSSSSSRRRLGRESSKKKIRHARSASSSSLDDSKKSKQSGGSVSPQRSLFAKVKASSWNGGCRVHKDEYNMSKHGARDANAELAALETLVEEYKKEHEHNQQEVRSLRDEKMKMASKLARVSTKYDSVVGEKHHLYSQLQASQHGMDKMRRQLERVSASCGPHHVPHTSSPRARRKVYQGQRPEHCRQQLTPHAEQGLVREYKERFMSPPEGQDSIPIARAIPFPDSAVAVVMEVSDSEIALASQERTRSFQSRAVPPGREGSACVRSVASRSQHQASCLDDSFQGLAIDHQASISPRSVASARRVVTNHRSLELSGSSAFSRYGEY
jgi:hypothetical protein